MVDVVGNCCGEQHAAALCALLDQVKKWKGKAIQLRTGKSQVDRLLSEALRKTAVDGERARDTSGSSGPIPKNAKSTCGGKGRSGLTERAGGRIREG